MVLRSAWPHQTSTLTWGTTSPSRARWTRTRTLPSCGSTNRPRPYGVVKGDNVLVECLVTSASPRSVTVTWSHGGQLVDLDDRRFEVSEDVTRRGLRNTLVIHSARETDFGPYNCSVQNAYGTDVFEILLNKKKTLPVLLTLFGVTAGIVLVLVAALIVILCAKRTPAAHKASKTGLPEKTVALQIADQNSTGNESDLKVELEQRTGSSLSNPNKDSGGWGTVVVGGEEKDSGGGGSVGVMVGAEHCVITPTTYLTSTTSPADPSYLMTSTTSPDPYLYNNAFMPAPLKINGHISNNRGGLSYGNYVDHSTLTNNNTTNNTNTIPPSATTQSPPHAPTSPTTTTNTTAIGATGGGYIMGGVGGGVGGVVGGGMGSYTNTPPPGSHPMYAYNNGYANHNYKAPSSSSSTLPLSLHVTTSRGNGGPGGVGAGGGGHNAAATIPRLGIPVDPSQYIVPPRTQVMQGSLATHV
ncbi:hypothetical protein Pcinc_031441 [Petrolisthes cinctipes]|uniref:Ig-like domain-containing protein n=1 Tax=Petrolisthes cinctipes TaxID=88211 RepID=A0AAE1EWL7_PETCI|nr:hypothetical protein Pcinc_031441 [Petrolisthes cinctipes]